ncbi:MAG: zinc ribbon domain-containing protein [Ruminiclostridium sp.]|nr:zinc ribbon domain-containing protein [Ruminiclostridium sp.]
MFCNQCGSRIDDNARFCPMCGNVTGTAAAVSDTATSAPPGQPARTEPIRGQLVTENIYLCPDGVFRWVYEFRMMKNPTIFFTILKIFGVMIGGVFLFDLILLLIDGDLDMDSFLGNVKIFGIIFLVFAVLAFVSYVIVAAKNGWKYMVLFEMDENGVTHTQMQKQFEKAQAMGWLTALAGIAAGDPTLAGAGIISAVHDSVHSEFSKVKNIKVLRRRGVIKVNEMLFKNQIYVGPGDFDFVLNYINARIPDSAARK